MVYYTKSAADTQKLASELSQEYLEMGGVFALSGELGAGKTTFVQGFSKGLGIKDRVISPTFVLVRQHQIPETEKMLFHIDLYRLEGELDVESLGISELWGDRENLVLIEWAEKIEKELPQDAVYISIEKTSNDGRKITVTKKG